MPRLPRCDRPGRWFHIFNRGLAHRPVFENREDVRYFLACLAWAVRRGEIEVHAYCILTTHFHLLVRSPSGSISVAMDRVLNAYVRYYNRTRGRDGSLFRGRYGAKPVTSLAYRRILIRYIDRNPVQARLAPCPWDYPYGSAWHYARPSHPKWLSTDWVDGQISLLPDGDRGAKYRRVFGGAWKHSEQVLVEERMQAPVDREDDLDDLIGAAPHAVRAWMRRKAELADGRALALPCADRASIHAVLTDERTQRPGWTFETRTGRSGDAWPLAETYLLRQLAALGWTEIGKRTDCSGVMASRRGRQAQGLIQTDPDFAERVARLVRRILERV